MKELFINVITYTLALKIKLIQFRDKMPFTLTSFYIKNYFFELIVTHAIFFLVKYDRIQFENRSLHKRKTRNFRTTSCSKETLKNLFLISGVDERYYYKTRNCTETLFRLLFVTIPILNIACFK